MGKKHLLPRTMQLFYKLQEQCGALFFDQAKWQALEESINNEKNGFIQKIRQRYTLLSFKDLCLIMLMVIGISNTQIAEFYHIELSSLRKKRHRIVRKTGVDGMKSLDIILKEFSDEII